MKENTPQHEFYNIPLNGSLRKRSVLDTIKADLHRHEGFSGFSGFLKGWFKPGFRYTFLLRLIWAQKKSSPFRVLLKILRRRYRFKYGFEISLDAQIGEGFYLSDHCAPILIAPVKIGKHCNISHGVTIGHGYKNGQKGLPTLGDRVWVGPYAVVVGNITVGSDVMIAPNTFLNVNVPDNSIVIGNPAKIIERVNPTSHYIKHVLSEN